LYGFFRIKGAWLGRTKGTAMADLLDKKTAAETRTPTAPEKQRLDLRPKLEKPPAPKIYRWIQWMALFVVAAAAAVLAAVLLGGSDEDAVTAPGGQEAEHGQYTQAVLVDRPAAAVAGFVGTNPPNLDPDPAAPEHGDFTPALQVDRTGAASGAFVGTSPPNFDPDPTYPEHGAFTGAVLVDRTGATTQAFVGTNIPDLDPDGG
jgi:hypothetical protein